MKKQSKNRLIVILGQTASGKTDLSIKLAKKFNAEIVSADSRQVYQGMDIGTGKISKKEMQSIPHYLLDVASPKRKFTIAQYKKLALKKIHLIHKKNKIPFLVGGTGFYIKSIVEGIVLPEVKPNWTLRKKLEKKNAQELFEILKKIDLKRSKTIETKNKRRLVRAIEIATSIGKSPELKKYPEFDVLVIGIKKEKKDLNKLIKKRLLKRLKQGLVVEIKKLHKNGVSWKRLEEFGLEYRFVAQYVQGKMKYNEMIEKLQKEIEHFAKRQMTWFKRDKKIKWIKTYRQAEKFLEEFIGSK
jgi:tRNA dimethylallyltransferase